MLHRSFRIACSASSELANSAKATPLGLPSRLVTMWMLSCTRAATPSTGSSKKVMISSLDALNGKPRSFSTPVCACAPLLPPPPPPLPSVARGCRASRTDGRTAAGPDTATAPLEGKAGKVIGADAPAAIPSEVAGAAVTATGSTVAAATCTLSPEPGGTVIGAGMASVPTGCATSWWFAYATIACACIAAAGMEAAPGAIMPGPEASGPGSDTCAATAV
jgi:hypothetical protein